jgi:hypothetical protein
MNDTVEMRNLPWHIMHRHLAETNAETGSYAIVHKQGESQPHWRYTPLTGSWLSRSRNGVGVGASRR